MSMLLSLSESAVMTVSNDAFEKLLRAVEHPAKSTPALRSLMQLNVDSVSALPSSIDAMTELSELDQSLGLI